MPELARQIWSLSGELSFQDLGDYLMVEDANGNPVQPGLPVGRLYERWLEEPASSHLFCRAGACFAVSKSTIQQRPKAFYQQILNDVLQESLGPWAIE